MIEQFIYVAILRQQNSFECGVRSTMYLRRWASRVYAFYVLSKCRRFARPVLIVSWLVGIRVCILGRVRDPGNSGYGLYPREPISKPTLGNITTTTTTTTRTTSLEDPPPASSVLSTAIAALLQRLTNPPCLLPSCAIPVLTTLPTRASTSHSREPQDAKFWDNSRASSVSVCPSLIFSLSLGSPFFSFPHRSHYRLFSLFVHLSSFSLR